MPASTDITMEEVYEMNWAYLFETTKSRRSTQGKPKSPRPLGMGGGGRWGSRGCVVTM